MDQVSLLTFAQGQMSHKDSFEYIVSTYKVPGPVLGAGFLSWIENEFSKQNLTAYSAHVRFLLLPICSPGQAPGGPQPAVPNGLGSSQVFS